VDTLKKKFTVTADAPEETPPTSELSREGRKKKRVIRAVKKFGARRIALGEMRKTLGEGSSRKRKKRNMSTPGKSLGNMCILGGGRKHSAAIGSRLKERETTRKTPSRRGSEEGVT